MVMYIARSSLSKVEYFNFDGFSFLLKNAIGFRMPWATCSNTPSTAVFEESVVMKMGADLEGKSNREAKARRFEKRLWSYCPILLLCGWFFCGRQRCHTEEQGFQHHEEGIGGKRR